MRYAEIVRRPRKVRVKPRPTVNPGELKLVGIDPKDVPPKAE